MKQILVAPRTILSQTVAAMAEEMRTDDIGVTILDLRRAKLPAGNSWWEWDPRIEGRLPPLPDQVDIDRMGALAQTDGSGQRGIMHFVWSEPATGGLGRTEILPASFRFDWRESFEPPESLVEAASIAEVRQVMSSVLPLDATLVEMEGSPAFMASLGRRFGVAQNPYFAAELEAIVPGGSEDMFEDRGFLQRSMQEANQEATFMLAVSLLLNTAPLVVSQCPRGSKQVPPGLWGDSAPFTYAVLHAGNSTDVRSASAGGRS